MADLLMVGGSVQGVTKTYQHTVHGLVLVGRINWMMEEVVTLVMSRRMEDRTELESRTADSREGEASKDTETLVSKAARAVSREGEAAGRRAGRGARRPAREVGPWPERGRWPEERRLHRPWGQED